MQDLQTRNVRAAVYARVSTDEQREGQTIDSQIAELSRFADDKGWRTVAVYKDDGWSGSMLARPELDRLRDDASHGHFEVILINDVDRLARDVSHLGIIKRDLEKNGVQVIFKKLPAEKSPTYNLMVNILGSFAEFERELIADRVRRGKRHKVEVRKQYLGSIAPYGFRYIRKGHGSSQEGQFKVNPEEAAIVRQMYSWLDQDGLSARSAVDRLNQIGVRPRKGSKVWAKSTVLRILRSEVYAGIWHYNKLEACVPRGSDKAFVKYRRSLKTSNRLRPRSEWLPVPLPESHQIIKREQWERVQQQLDRNMAFSARNEKHSYLLKGLVRCAACGSRYVGEPCHGKFYYRCMGRCKLVPTIQEEYLNSIVWSAIERALLNPDIIADQIVRVSHARSDLARNVNHEATELEEAVQQLGVEEQRVIEAYRLSALSAEQLARELQKIRARKGVIESKKESASRRINQLAAPKIERSLAEYCEIAARRLRTLGIKGRQHFLRLLVREIVFSGNKVIIKAVLAVSATAQRNSSNPASNTPGGIATTEIEHPGHNPALISDDFTAPEQPQDDRWDVHFEMERPVPRLPHSRPFQAATEAGHPMKLAA